MSDELSYRDWLADKYGPELAKRFDKLQEECNEDFLERILAPETMTVPPANPDTSRARLKFTLPPEPVVSEDEMTYADMCVSLDGFTFPPIGQVNMVRVSNDSPDRLFNIICLIAGTILGVVLAGWL